MSSFQSSNHTLTITVSPTHYNIWIVIVKSPAFVFSQVVVSLVALLAAGGSVYCLIFLPRDRFPQLSHVILILELIANTQRFLYFAIDPLLSRNIFNYIAGVIQMTISIPFSLSASLLIGIFWYSLVKYKIHKSNGLLHEKVVFPCLLMVTLICLIEICFEIAIGVLPLGPAERTMIFVEQAVFALITVLIFVFYIYTGVMLVRTLKKTNSENPMILKIRFLLRILVFIMLVLLIVCVGFVTPIYDTAVGFFGIWFFGHFALACQGIVHVYAFLPGKVEDVSSQKRSSITNMTKEGNSIVNGTQEELVVTP